MKTILLIIFSFITLNAQSRIIPFNTNPTPSTGTAHYTDSLKSFWYYEDLAMDNSSVSSWASSVGSPFILTATGTEQPTTTTTGVSFDGGDALTDTTLAYVSTGNPYSIGIVFYSPDTTTATYQMLFGIRNTNVLVAVGFAGTGKLYTVGWDGTNLPEFATYGTPAWGDTVYVVATYDGTNTMTLWINGVSYSDNDNLSNFQNGSTTEMGGDNTGNDLYVANGTKILAVEIYNKVLSEADIDQNVLYYQGLGDLP